MTNLDDMMLMALANRTTGMPVNVSADGESLVLAEDGANERPPLRIDIEGVGQQTPPEEVGPPPEEDITAVATEMAAGTEPEGATPMSLGEFATTVADVPAGLVKGAVQGTVGAPADIYSIGRAIYSAANPNPGETRLQAFIRSIGDPVEVFGYDVTTEGIKKIIDGTIGPLVPEGASDRRLEAAKTAETTGEIMALGKMANQIAVGMFKGAQVVGRGVNTGSMAVADKAVQAITGNPQATAMAVLEEAGQMSPLKAINISMFPKEVAKVAQRVDKGSVKISDKVSKDQILQLAPEYRVKVSGAYKPEGSGQNITNTINPGNYQEMSVRLDELSAAFPDPLESPERFASMMATVYNSTEVPIPPRWLIQSANNMDEWANWFGKMAPNQIAEASRGFSIVDKFKTIYGDGTATADTTGRLMMWAMLSRRASAYPHESGFLDLAEQMTPLIQKAVRGDYTEADVQSGLSLIQKYIPAGSPGKSVTSNANDFVRTFLVKMSDKMPDGRTKLQALHDMIADPSMTGPQIRRAFYGLADSVGIKNKVLSFALLVSGRTDVMVLDRIQINRLFGDGTKIYDDVAQIFDGGPGLAMYEGMERSIEKRIKDLYAKVGRPDDASLGRYHWESWVLSSGQEVAHPTLETMVRAAKGEASPYTNVPVMEGRTHKTAYGVKYQRLPNGKNQFVYSASDGTEYAMTKSQLDEMLDSVVKGKEKLVPKDFPGVNFFEKDVLPDGKPNPYFGKPWYTWPGVDKNGIDKRAAKYGTRINPSSGGQSMEAVVRSSASNGPSGNGRTPTVKRGQAPAKGAK